MSDYAVINPATGEQIKTYPTITDDELDRAIGQADETHQGWLRSTSVEERAAEPTVDLRTQCDGRCAFTP